MAVAECSWFGNWVIIGSSHAVRFGNLHGRGGVNRGNREVGLAVSGQTMEGLRRDLSNLQRQDYGALVFIGANDVLASTTAVMDGRLTVDQPRNYLRAQTKNLLRQLLRVFPEVVFCETISCRWRYPRWRTRDGTLSWFEVSQWLEKAVKRVPLNEAEKSGSIYFVPTNSVLGRRHYEEFMGHGLRRRRDFIHLNEAGYNVVATRLARFH